MNSRKIRTLSVPPSSSTFVGDRETSAAARNRHRRLLWTAGTKTCSDFKWVLVGLQLGWFDGATDGEAIADVENIEGFPQNNQTTTLASMKGPPPPPQNPSFGCRGILNRDLRCIVKLGGAAITCKNEIETINEENLKMVSLQLRRAMAIPDSSDEFLGMNWSKPDGGLDYVSEVENDCCPKLDLDSFVIVHGAGSFGHFQASKSGVHKGGLHLPLVKAGFVATRISVTSLNLEVVKALAREGIPSLGMSPLACGWSTVGRNMASADISHVIEVINNGFVPVLHGDAVLDDLQGCTILSGDVIIRYLAQQLRPDYVVFLTDVFGVYDRPPTDPSAILLREIVVNEDGSWHILNPTVAEQVDFTVAAHDTTGGMVTKISEAAMIAKLGIDVYIVKAGTSHSLRALKGEMTRDNIAGDWLGTIIRGSKTV